MRKLARITTCVFEARHSPIGAKRCYGSKISNGGFIKVTIGLKKPMRKRDMVRCLLMGQISYRIHKLTQIVQGARLYQCESCFKGGAILMRPVLRKEQSWT
jgi:hypothetical protein